MSRSLGRTAVLVTTLIAGLCTAPAPAAAALVAYWSFDGCSTSNAGNSGIALTAVGGPVCTAGPFGSAWQLNGSDQYLAAGSTATFAPGARAWSVAAWAKSTSSTGLEMIVDWYRCGANPACGASDGALYNLGLDHGQPYWNVRDDNASDLTAQDSTRNLADGAWHLLVGTVNPATDSTRLYVDGALVRAVHGPISSFNSGGVAIPLEVGRHFVTGWGLPGYYFTGAIDEVRIYDDELTAAAVASLFTSNATTAVTTDGAPGFSIDCGWPNPTRGGRLRVAFTLPIATPARLSLFDISGRRLADLALGLAVAGHHEIELHDGRGLAPGLYLVRLSQGGRVCSRRVTILE